MYIIDMYDTFYDLSVLRQFPDGLNYPFIELDFIGSYFVHYNDPIWDDPLCDFKFMMSDNDWVRFYRRADDVSTTLHYHFHSHNGGSRAGSFTGITRATIYPYIQDTNYSGYNPYNDPGFGGFLFNIATPGTPFETNVQYRYESPQTYRYICISNELDWESFLNGRIYDGDYTGPDSDTGGGTGNFDNSSDNIVVPSYPNTSIIDSSMIALFSPNLYEVNQLSQFLWTDTFYEAFVKLLDDPLEAIVSLSMTFANLSLGAKYNMKIGLLDTGVSMNIINSQYTTLDCGSIEIREYWGNSLDYSPYTNISIYLPFIGVQSLNTDYIMNSTLNVKYIIDVLTGCCSCFITVSKNNLNSVLYNFTGNVSFDVPLSSSNMNSTRNTLISTIANGAVATLNTSGAITALEATSALVVSASKRSYNFSGRLDTVSGALSIKTPYLIISRPVQSRPTNYFNFYGAPSNITETLSNLSGFTQVDSIHLENIQATDTELSMIENILKSGVIL